MTISRRHFLTGLCGAGALATSPLFDSAHAIPRSYAVTGTVIKGDGTPPLVDHGILVDAGRIAALVPAQELKGRVPLLFHNATIMPGVINCHVHSIHSPQDRRERFLLHGVTSIGNCASPLEALLQLIANPAGQTTTAACTGPMLCPPGGYPIPVHHGGYGLVITSPAHGREQVRRLADLGVTNIKISFEPGPYPKPWPLFDAPTAAAICDEGRRHNLPIRCHVEDFGGLKAALEAGVHTIEHVPHRWIENGNPRPILNNGELISEYRTLLDRMVRESVILTPTLDVLSRSLWNGPDLYAPVHYFAQAGGRIALGNDYPYRRTDAGMPLREMQLLAKADLTNNAILTAATSNSAAACGFSDRGIIAPGMRADILLLDGNPLSDIQQLQSPTAIIKDGILIK